MEQPIKKNKFSYFARFAFGFVHKRSGNEIILSANDAAEILDKARSTTKRKSEKLLRKKQLSVSHTSLVDKTNWVINLSSRTLSEAGMSLLKKGFNFTVTPASVQAKEV